MQNIKNLLLLLSLSFVLIVSSCMSVSEMVSDDEEILESADQVGQLLADIQQEQEEMANELNDSVIDPPQQTLEEKIEPAPTQEYDSIVLDQSEPIIKSEKTLSENKAVKENTRFQDFQSTISKLNINDKIQYRVATINFYSGSSNVNGIGLKKIKKIAKIAKERDAKIKIVGHASKRTRDMPLAKHKLVNFKISDKRAQSVANVFIKKYKFPSSALITEAVADTKPLFKENMPAGTKANQRTEIFLIY